MLTRDAILAQLARRTKIEPSAVFGGDVTIRELLRSEFRAVRSAALAGASLDADLWNAGIFAAAVVDAAGVPLFQADELLAWPDRSAVWDEVLRIAKAALDLSEVGPDFLPKPSSGSPATPGATPSTAAN